MTRILKASAGSGKTYNLAKEYIRLLLESREPDAYRHILAVTFTNKATDEMKQRILKELYVLSSTPEESPYYADFLPLFKGDSGKLRARSLGQLCAILHDYSAFSVSTIDRFFQQALRAFSREIGQFASYQVDLDREALVAESVDRVLDSLTPEDKLLLGWLTESARSQLEKSSRFNLQETLGKVAVFLRSDDYKRAVERYGIDEESAFSKERLARVRKVLNTVIDGFTGKVSGSAEALTKILEASGVPAEKSAGRGFLMKLYNYAEANSRTLIPYPSVSFFNGANDPSKWFAKANASYVKDLQEAGFEKPFSDFCALFETSYSEYSTAYIMRAQLYGLGVVHELREAFSAVQKEKNTLSLDDSNTILKSIIDGSDAPFIYEKLGVRYEHFLLDEFQDTALIQWENFLPLVKNADAGGFDNLIVGDVKQAIYRWRGSDWTLLGSKVQRQLSVPDDEEHITPLKKNFRSCRAIVDFNNAFFPFAAETLDGELGLDPSSPESLSSLYADVSQEACFGETEKGSVDMVWCEDQMAEILSTIESVRAHEGKYGDIAILVRDNRDARSIASMLVDSQIPVVSDESLEVKSSVTVRRLSSILSLVDSPDADGAHPSVKGFLARELNVNIPSSYHSLLDLAEGILRDLRLGDSEHFEAEIPHIQAFMDFLQEWVGVNGNNLSAFLKAWDKADITVNSPDGGNAVRVMTIHKAKGLEFPYVILPFAEKIDMFKESAYWCRPALEGTFIDPLADGIYPVSLNSGSERTCFSERYHRERYLQCVDNLNVLYVALTRPVYGIKVISAPVPKSFTGSSWSNFSQLLRTYVKSDSYSSGSMYDFSRMKRPARLAGPVASYPSWPVDERGRLSFSSEAYDYFGPDGSIGADASRRLRGLALHRILSYVRVPSDLEAAVERVMGDGEVEASQKEEVMSLLSRAVSDGASRGWFPDDGSRILIEAPIVDRWGNVHRPDRVVIRPDGGVVVIDYKFGRRDDAYIRQVQSYMELFRKMGYEKLEGYVWYVSDFSYICIH